MLWFKGSVPEAIAESKRIRSVFVVYIKGDDEESKKMDILWGNEEISAVCLVDCTAVNFHVDSLEGKQFASLYPVVCVPCTYFIDGNGIPLEVIGGSLPTEQFLDKVKKVIETHRIKFPKVEPESSSSASTSQSEPTQSNELVEEPNDPGPALNERVARAKELVKEKRKEKEENEKKDARRKELERRKDGQQILKAKAEREEKLAQQMAERVRQEKAKDKAARKAIREKIAQDKAERAAREEIEKEERRNISARIDPQLTSNVSTVQCSDVRLQFRLPDGCSITQTFPVDTPLEAAREFVSTKMNMKKKITFWTTFPRKRLSEEEFSRTLSDLGLAPSAVLVVDPSSSSPSKSSGDSSGSSSLSSIITWFLAPLLALFSFLKVFLFAKPEQPRGSIQRDASQSTNNPNTSSYSRPTSDVRRRTRDSGKTEEPFKKDGKIHSFKQGDNDDDENNTWNGNSTQQM